MGRTAANPTREGAEGLLWQSVLEAVLRDFISEWCEEVLEGAKPGG